MIWALLALLGVPIWLIVGALVSIAISRRRFRAQDGVFALAIRSAGDDKWPRVPSYGRSFPGLLVVNAGLALVRTSIYEVEHVGELTIDTQPRKPDDAVGRLLTLRDGSSLELGVAAGDVALVGNLGRVQPNPG